MLTKTKLLASKKDGEQLKPMKIGFGASESFKSMLVINQRHFLSSLLA